MVGVVVLIDREVGFGHGKAAVLCVKRGVSVYAGWVFDHDKLSTLIISDYGFAYGWVC